MDVVPIMTSAKSASFELQLPEPALEEEVATRVAQTLCAKHSVGKYCGSVNTNKILNDLVSAYNQELVLALEEIACNELVGIALSEFRKCKRMEDAETSVMIDNLATIDKNLMGVRLYGRTHKYLAERTTALGRERPRCTSKPEFQRHFYTALICCREIVQLSGLSDQIRNDVFYSYLEIRLPPAGPVGISVNVSNFERFESRVALNNRERARIFADGTFELNLSQFESVLNPVMTKTLGYSFSDACEILVGLDSRTRPEPASIYQVNFVDVSLALSRLHEWFPEIAVSNIERVISGFTISSAELKNRTYYNPQEEHRALNRCFFQLTLNGEPHLAWVHELFFDAFNLMQRKISHGELPEDWTGPQLAEALGKINRARGSWFEGKVLEQTKLLGLEGTRSKKTINVAGKKVPIEPGEIDYIGWSAKDNALVFLEAKMLEWAGEPKAVKQQIDKFEKPKGFVEKYLKKCRWITENHVAIISELEAVGIKPVTPTSLKTAFITYDPSAVSPRISAFPCVSLAEFVYDFERAQGWPYTVGVFDLPL